MANILYFGKLTDLAGCSRDTFDGAATLSQIIGHLSRQNAPLGTALIDRSTRAAINLNLVEYGQDPLVQSDDELAFMPPVSGG
jgi:molybdopterin converting factor small subunit